MLALLLAACSAASAQQARQGPADPGVRDTGAFDDRRPVARELQTDVPDGFTVVSVGDMIISRPLSQYAARVPAFAAVVQRLTKADVSFGNLETTIFDARTFKGAPYSWEGDWTNASLPAVARDLRSMGVDIVARANNHSMDWGLEGLRETSQWLDEAGIVHAGVGETQGIARAPQYLETPSGRVALVSFASTFRPSSEAQATSGAAPGRPGLSALHVSTFIDVPSETMKSLAAVDCSLYKRHCDQLPDELRLFGNQYRKAASFSYEYVMDPQDLAQIYRSIRAAQQNADFVIVAIHSHECSIGCDDDNAPRGAANFLKQLAHDAIDSGADLFVATGNHNLGAVEIYKSPNRGYRPIFYGLGNFFWSDVQELLPRELFQQNRSLLGNAWQDPDKATEYDLTAPLNKNSFAHAFTFQSVIAECRFEHNQLSRIELHPVEEGYGRHLPESGLPRMVTERSVADDIFSQINQQTVRFGLAPLKMRYAGGVAVLEPSM